MASIGKAIVKGAFWLAAETWGRQAALFIVFLFLASYLGPEALGLAALAMSVPQILVILVAQGVPDALMQRKDADDIHFDTAFWFQIGFGAVISFAIWLSAGLIAAGLGLPALEELISWTSLIVFIQSISTVPAAFLKRNLKFKLFAVRALIGVVTGGVVGIGLAVAGYGVWSLIAMQIARASVEMVVLLVGSGWFPRVRFDVRRLKDLLRFGTPLVGQSFVYMFMEEVPKLGLGLAVGPIAVGIYALGRRFLDFFFELFTRPIVSLAMPAVSRLQDEPDKVDAFFNRALRMSLFIGIPSFAGFAAVAPVFVPLAFGDAWIGAIMTVQLMMVLGFSRTVESITGWTMIALGHSGLTFKIVIGRLLMTLLAVFVGAQFGVEATVLMLIATGLLYLPVFLYFTNSVGNIQVGRPFGMVPALLAATGLMFVCVSALVRVGVSGGSEIVTLAVAVALGALVYGVAAIFLMRPDLLEVRALLFKMRRQAP